MAVLTREELMQNVTGFLGERDDDEALTFLGDLTDTLDSLDKQGDEITRLEADNKRLRDEYKQRFLTGTTPVEDIEPKKPKSFWKE